MSCLRLSEKKENRDEFGDKKNRLSMKILREEVIDSYFCRDDDQDIFYPWGVAFCSYFVTPEEKKKIVLKLHWERLLGVTFMLLGFGLHLGYYNDSTNSTWIFALGLCLYTVFHVLVVKTWLKDLDKRGVVPLKNDDSVWRTHKYYRGFLFVVLGCLAVGVLLDHSNIMLWISVGIAMVFYGTIVMYSYSHYKKTLCIP